MLDVAKLARRLVTWPSLALVCLGLLFGLIVRFTSGAGHSVDAAWQLAPVTCPLSNEATPASPIDRFNLPASLADGPDGASLGCQLEEALMRCTAYGPSESATRRTIEALGTALLKDDSPVQVKIGELRFAVACHALYDDSTPTYPSLRRAAFAGAHLAAAPGADASRPLLPRAPLFGGLAGVLAALFLAGWRARQESAPVAIGEGLGRVAPALLVGLMITCSMSRLLAVEVGPFTVRFAQLCAFAFCVAAVVERIRRRVPVTLPAGPALAALAYLCVAATSAAFSENPGKSLGYLCWAGFDLLVVFGGIVLWACNERRLAFALKLWLGGIALAMLMGVVQMGAWLLGLPPPLGYWDQLGLPRADGFSTEPSYYALYLVPGALVLLSRAAQLGRRGLSAFALGAGCITAVAFSTSRSGWLGLAVGVVALVTMLFLRSGRGAALRLSLGAVGGIALCGVLLAASPTLRAHLARFARMGVDVTETTSSAPRLASMAEAARIFASHPVLGVGFGGYGAAALRHPASLRRMVDTDVHAVVTVNLYLEIAAETGALGLFAVLALLRTILAPLWRRKHAAGDDGTADGLLLASLVVMLVMFQFNQTLWRLDIWILLALSFAAGARAPRKPEM